MSCCGKPANLDQFAFFDWMVQDPWKILKEEYFSPVVLHSPAMFKPAQKEEEEK